MNVIEWLQSFATKSAKYVNYTGSIYKPAWDDPSIFFKKLKWNFSKNNTLHLTTSFHCVPPHTSSSLPGFRIQKQQKQKTIAESSTSHESEHHFSAEDNNQKKRINSYKINEKGILTSKSTGILISTYEHLQPELNFRFKIISKGFVAFTVLLINSVGH